MCWLLDLPAPVSLGAAVGVLTVIPLIGTFVGGLPALLLAFGSDSWPVGVTVLALLVVLQAIEVLVVRPTSTTGPCAWAPPWRSSSPSSPSSCTAQVEPLYAIALAVLALAALDAYGAERDDE